mmetsp:Transcript_44439/g.71330  ORF Transcript_44439/g.71330 Transcript_44439/m.71330 type:complete len:221 (-) Transcript_44439:7-669(-)
MSTARICGPEPTTPGTGAASSGATWTASAPLHYRRGRMAARLHSSGLTWRATPTVTLPPPPPPPLPPPSPSLPPPPRTRASGSPRWRAGAPEVTLGSRSRRPRCTPTRRCSPPTTAPRARRGRRTGVARCGPPTTMSGTGVVRTGATSPRRARSRSAAGPRPTCGGRGSRATPRWHKSTRAPGRDSTTAPPRRRPPSSPPPPPARSASSPLIPGPPPARS